MRLKETLYHLKETMGIAPWTREQVFNVKINVELQNSSSTEQPFIVIVPLPQQAETQKRETELSFSDQTITLDRDEEYKNEYAVWSGALLPKEKRQVQATCKVRVQPVKKQLSAGVKNDTHAVQSNRFINATAVQKIAKKIGAEASDFSELVQAVNEYVITTLHYGFPIKNLYTVQQALEKREVDCGGFDTLFCSILATLGIPTRIVSGFWAGGRSQKEAMHAWCEFMAPSGEWIPADPSIEHLVRNGRDRTHSGRLGFVGSDRIIFSVGCDIPIRVGDIATAVDILQHPFFLQSSPSVQMATNYCATRV